MVHLAKEGKNILDSQGRTTALQPWVTQGVQYPTSPNSMLFPLSVDFLIFYGKSSQQEWEKEHFPLAVGRIWQSLETFSVVTMWTGVITSIY